MRPYYEQDGITIYHGDFLELADQVGPYDAVSADPPYGQTSCDWDKWPDGWTKLGGTSMWCFGTLRMFMERAACFAASGWKMSQDIVWEKHNGSSFHADRFRRVHEQAVHFYRGEWSNIYRSVPKVPDARRRTVRRKQRPPHMGEIGEGVYRSVDGGPLLMRSVIYARSEHGRAVNETQKPIAIVEPLIEYACPPGGTILVPFVGSGTDLVAARRMGRKAIGIELREQQCEEAVKRLSQALLHFDEVSA